MSYFLLNRFQEYLYSIKYKFPFLLLLICIFSGNPCFLHAQAKSVSSSYDTLGNGAVKITTYLFSSGDKLTLSPEKTNAFLSDTYIIQNGNVLHDNKLTLNSGNLVPVNSKKALIDSSTNEVNLSGGTSTIAISSKITWTQYKYVIDWKKQQVFIFGAPMPADTIFKMKLADMSYDFFYFPLATGKRSDSVQLSNDRSVIIAGHVCSSGTAIIKKTGSKVKFYYTKDNLGLVSPLNGFIDPSRHINVMAVFAKEESNPEANTTFFFKIDELIQGKFDNKLFALPDKVTIKPVKKNELSN